MTRALHFAALALIAVVMTVGLTMASQARRAEAAPPPLEIALSGNGVVPADGQDQQVTVTVRDTIGAVAGAAVYLNDSAAAAGTTDSLGVVTLLLPGANTSQRLTFRAVAPDGREQRAEGAVLAAGDAAVDLKATGRNGDSVAGYLHLPTLVDIDLTIPAGGSMWIFPARSHRGYFHAWDPSGDRLFVEGAFVLAAGTRSDYTFRGDDPALVPLTVQSPGTGGNIEVNRADSPYPWPSDRAAGSGGVTRVWLRPGRYDVVHDYETSEAHFVLTALDHAVEAPGSLITLSDQNLARIVPTILPGFPEISPSLQVTPTVKYASTQYSDLSKPTHVTPGTYASIRTMFQYGGYYYSWRTGYLDLSPITLQAGEYGLTVGGTIRTSLQLAERTIPGRPVRATVTMESDYGTLEVQGGDLTVTVLGPNQENLPVTVDPGGTGFAFTPPAVGRYTVTAVRSAGPLLSPANAAATAYVEVNESQFEWLNWEDGKGIGRTVVLWGRVNENVTASAMEITHWNFTQEVPVGPDRRFRYAIFTPPMIPAGTEVSFTVRIKGDPSSEQFFSGTVDDTAPTMTVQTMSLSGSELTVTGGLWENMPDNMRDAILEYALDQAGADWTPGVSRTTFSVNPVGQTDRFTVRWVPPQGPANYRVRLRLRDWAGQLSPWAEFAVTLPSATIEVTPANRILTPGIANTVSVQMRSGDQPVQGLPVTILDPAGNAAATGITGEFGGANLTFQPVEGGVYQLLLGTDAAPVYRALLFAPGPGEGAMELQVTGMASDHFLRLFTRDGEHVAEVPNAADVMLLPPGHYTAVVSDAFYVEGQIVHVLMKPFTVAAGASTTVSVDAAGAEPLPSGWALQNGTQTIPVDWGRIMISRPDLLVVPVIEMSSNGLHFQVLPGSYWVHMTGETESDDRIDLAGTLSSGNTTAPIQVSEVAVIPNLEAGGRDLMIETPRRWLYRLAPGKKLYLTPETFELEYRIAWTDGDVSSGHYAEMEAVFSAGRTTLGPGYHEELARQMGGPLTAAISVQESLVRAGGMVSTSFTLSNAYGHSYLYTRAGRHEGEAPVDWEIIGQASAVLKKDGVAVSQPRSIQINGSSPRSVPIPENLESGTYTLEVAFDDQGYTPSRIHADSAELTVVGRSLAVTLTPVGRSDTIYVLPGGELDASIKAKGFTSLGGVTEIAGTVGIEPLQWELVGSPQLHAGLAAAGATVAYDSATGQLAIQGALTTAVTLLEEDTLLTFRVKARLGSSGPVRVDFGPATLAIKRDGTAASYWVDVEKPATVLRTAVTGVILKDQFAPMAAISVYGSNVTPDWKGRATGHSTYTVANPPAGTVTLAAASLGFLPALHTVQVQDQATSTQDLDLHFGDVNGDWAITRDDLQAGAEQMGPTSGWNAADANQNGVVDLTDLAAAARNFGLSTAATGTGSIEGTVTCQCDRAHLMLWALGFDGEFNVLTPVAEVWVQRTQGGSLTYRFPKVPPGQYQVELTVPGVPEVVKEVTVSSGEVVQIDF